MTAAIWRASRVIACLASLLGGAVHAQSHNASDEPASEPAQARVQARVYGMGPLGSRQAGDYVDVVVRLRGPLIRIDFTGDNAPDAWLVNRGTRGQAWLVSATGNYTLPVADASGPYWYDPKAPCAVLGGRCAPAQGDFILGRLVAGWRYEDAAQGPDGTTSGILWIDTRTGLLLGYRGRTGRHGRERSMRVNAVSFEPISEALFEPPAGLRSPASPERR